LNFNYNENKLYIFIVLSIFIFNSCGVKSPPTPVYEDTVSIQAKYLNKISSKKENSKKKKSTESK